MVQLLRGPMLRMQERAALVRVLEPVVSREPVVVEFPSARRRLIEERKSRPAPRVRRQNKVAK